VHSEEEIVVLCPLSRKLYCIRIKMSLEAGIGAGSLERPLASLGAISFNPLAFTSDISSCHSFQVILIVMIQ
jgi:hypothetical protein